MNNSNEPNQSSQEPEETKERVFMFDKYDKEGKILETVTIPESELEPHHHRMLCDAHLREFNALPALAQDMFVRVIINEAMSHTQDIVEAAVKKAHNGKPPEGGRIITLD